MAGVQIGQADFLYFWILQQVIGARGALKARAKY
jgi:hypothetical protein